MAFQVIAAGQKQQVLEGCHSSGLGGGHAGRDKTLSKVSERCYWLGMVEGVKEFCKTCDKCQRVNMCVSTNLPHDYGATHPQKNHA